VLQQLYDDENIQLEGKWKQTKRMAQNKDWMLAETIPKI